MPKLLQYHDTVRDEWIDYNGHLSEAFYVLVFGDATTNLMEHVGIDERYRTENDASLYTVDVLVATEELMAIHVQGGKAAPFPDSVTERLQQHVLPAPDYAARSIG